MESITYEKIPEEAFKTEMTSSELKLKQRIAGVLDVKIAVIGVGYVGLPLAVKLAEKGFSVIGADRSKKKIEPLLNGKSTVEGISDERVTQVINSGHLMLLHMVDKDESDPDPRPDPIILEPLIGADVFVVCVHTPLHRDRGWEPDTQWIELAAKLIRFVCEIEDQSNRLQPERLIVLESTTYPGTTKSIFKKLLDDFSTKVNSEWYLAYSPERTDPSPFAHDENDASGHRSTFQIPRIVGGLNLPSKENAVTFYESVFSRVEPVDSLETAEMIKLVENTFRFVSIGFANEMAHVARTFGLNIWDIIRVAKTKGFGLDLCYPGLIGGHCIPIDPHYLSWAVRNQQHAATFVDVAERAHQDMKKDALDLIRRLLNKNNKGVYGTSIMFCGVAYKKNVGDIRESAILTLMKKLYLRGAQISFWDPALPPCTDRAPIRLAFSEKERGMLSESSLKRLKPLEGHSEKYLYYELEELSGEWKDVRDNIIGGKFDCVVLSTDHNQFLPAYEELILDDNAPPIADLRNAINFWLRGEANPAEMPTEDKAKELQQKLLQPGKYMLLGLH